MDLEDQTISDQDMVQFHVLTHARAWVESGQSIELRVPKLKSFTRTKELHDRNNPLRGRLMGLEAHVAAGTVLETALGLTDAPLIEVLGARVACCINGEAGAEAAHALEYLLSAALQDLVQGDAVDDDGGVELPRLLLAAQTILHRFIDLENCLYLSHFMRFAIVQDDIELNDKDQLIFFAHILAEAYAILHGPLPDLSEEEGDDEDEEELPAEDDEGTERVGAGMTEQDAMHLARLVLVIDADRFSRVAAASGTQPAKLVGRSNPVNVTRIPLSSAARAAQIVRANEMLSTLKESRSVGFARDATVQLADRLERTMGFERAKRFCELSFWAFFDDNDPANADTWEVMRTFMDMEFLCQMGRPFRLAHFRRDIEIVSDEEGGRIIIAGGASISFEGMRSLFRPSLGGAI